MSRIALDLARAVPRVAMRRRSVGPLHPAWSTAFEALVEALRIARARIDPLPPVEQRRAWDALSPPPLTAGRVRVATTTLAGVPASVVAPAARADAIDTVYYLHGGAYAFGSLATHRELVFRLALATGARVVVPEYRLAPESPFPAAIDDVAAAYRALLEKTPSSRMVLAGDSAGGGLTGALLVRARDEGLPLPAGAALLSPVVDVPLGDLPAERARTDWIDVEWAAHHTRHYVRDADPKHPWISPLRGAFAGLPPLFVQVGDAEILFDQACAYAEAARAAGVEVELDVHAGMVHAWQMFATVHAPANEAILRLARFVRERLAARRATSTPPEASMRASR
jgi:monoterpene epsilon-lactone hydrolase